MNSKWITFGVLFLGALAMAPLRAQQAAVQIPKTSGRWIIEVKPNSPAPAPVRKDSGAVSASEPVSPPAVVKSIEVTLNAPFRRDRISWSNDTVTEVWQLYGHWFLQNESGDIVILDSLESSLQGTWQPFDNQMLSWAGPKTSKGVSEFNKRPALLYEVTRSPNALADAPPQTVQLWVNAETNLPIAYRDLAGLYQFKFLEGSPGSLQPPDKYLKKLERFQSLRAAPPAYPGR